jgi:hypothetical protein
MKTIATLIVLVASLQLPAQTSQGRLKLYIDCQQTQCDLDFMRQQITIADFMRDRQTADVHILITTQSAGNGGQQYTIQMIGLHSFSQLTDTTSFFTKPADTENDIRTAMISRIKTSLVPFLIKAGQAGQVAVCFENKEGKSNEPVEKDKWNYWVFSFGGAVDLSGDKNYKETYLRGNFSASRVTEASKIDFSFYNSTSKNMYTFEDGNGKATLKTHNSFMEARHSYIKSLGPKWSAGYEATYYKSSYDNIRAGLGMEAGVEYNIFPYKASSSKFLVIRYMLEAESRNYLQETIYNKKQQALFSNELGVYASFRQPWGSISSFVSWYNYLHDIAKNNLSIRANVELRLFKGLSLGFYGNASLINDQLNLAKGGASTEEVLLRLKALSTNFNYYTGISLNYRFGSSLNNFVNPRFTDGY